MSLELALFVGSLVAAGAWGALALYLLAVERRRMATRRLLARAIAAIRRDDAQSLTVGDRPPCSHGH